MLQDEVQKLQQLHDQLAAIAAAIPAGTHLREACNAALARHSTTVRQALNALAAAGAANAPAARQQQQQRRHSGSTAAATVAQVTVEGTEGEAEDAGKLQEAWQICCSCCHWLELKLKSLHFVGLLKQLQLPQVLLLQQLPCVWEIFSSSSAGLDFLAALCVKYACHGHGDSVLAPGPDTYCHDGIVSKVWDG